MTVALAAASGAAVTCSGEEEDDGSTVIAVIRNGVRTMIHLDSPDMTKVKDKRQQPCASKAAARNSATPGAHKSVSGGAQKRKSAGVDVTRKSVSVKMTSVAAKVDMRAIAVKGATIAKGAPNNKLKNVMKKGKLPAFNFDPRSIFVNRNTSHSAKPAVPTVPQTASVNKENRGASTSTGGDKTAAPTSKALAASTTNIPSAASTVANFSTGGTKSSSAAAAAAAAATSGTAHNARRLSVRGGKETAKEAGVAGSFGWVPKPVSVTHFAVAQAQHSGTGRKRQSSEEAFMPAGLKCFVT